MKKLLILTPMLLFLSWTASLSQDIQTLPRWRKEAIVKDLIRGRECDSVKKIQDEKINLMAQENLQLQGVRIDLETKVDIYEKKIIPSKDQELKTVWNLYNEEKVETKKYKRRWIITGVVLIAVVVVEIFKE